MGVRRACRESPKGGVFFSPIFGSRTRDEHTVPKPKSVSTSMALRGLFSLSSVRLANPFLPFDQSDVFRALGMGGGFKQREVRSNA